jgi:hypothetical protein
MATYFSIRAINLAHSETPTSKYNNIIIGEQIAGNFLVALLGAEYDLLSMTGENGTCGNVCDTINGEPITVKESIRAHTQLIDFLDSKIFDHKFATVGQYEQRCIRDLRAMVKHALNMQIALDEIGASVVFTVTWG